MPHRIAALPLGAGIAVCATLIAAPTADGAPPGFPDLSAFTAVDPAPYVVRGAKTSTVRFTTPALTCSWDYQKNPDYLTHIGVTCQGTVPGLPSAAHDKSSGPCDSVLAGRDGGVRLYIFARGRGNCPPTTPEHRLPVGSSLTASGITCAVTDDGVACLDPVVNHGFVLTATGSWAF